MKFKVGNLIIGSAYISGSRHKQAFKHSFWIGLIYGLPTDTIGGRYQIFWMYVVNNSVIMRKEFEHYSRGYTESTFVLVPDDFLSGGNKEC